MSNHSNQPSQKWPGTSIQRKLLLVLLVVAIIPLTALLATFATNMYQSVAIMTAVVSQVIGLFFAYSLVSSLVVQAKAINQTLSHINHGNFEARAVTVTTDELGEAAHALNTLCDNTLNLIQSNDERDQIQTSIENLISQMKSIAAGDLTIAAEVNDGMTGSIAASVNHMTQQLRSIVRQVQSAAAQVTTSSARIRDASSNMSQDIDSQANRIGQASGQLLEMTEAFQNVAQLTKESVEVAVEARQTASNGLKAVSDTVDGMQRIRDQVQNTSKRIKRFGESSQEIGEIVQLISDIADRTSILALNASIQAAMAGDAGHGFAIVAEEIESLAERSTDATKQISKLIRSIQHETSEVISDMEESTREVVAGSQLATQAGETLFEIDSVSNQLVELIQTSSTSALQQAEMATKIAASMSEISQSTKDSAEKSREATLSVGRLSEMVSQLRDSVSRFTVSDSSDPFDFLNDPDERNLSFTTESSSEHTQDTERRDAALLHEVRGASDLLNDMIHARRDAEKTKSQSRNIPRDEQRPVTKKIQVEKSRKEGSTVVIDENAEQAIDDKLMRQVREGTVLLDGKREDGGDSKNSDNATIPISPDQDTSSRNPIRTMMLDDI